MSGSDICLTCIRISWQEWLKECDDAHINRNIVLGAKVMMSELYDADPTIFCSNPARTIKAGLIYLFSVYEGYSLTQKEIAKIFKCTPGALSAMYTKIGYRYMKIKEKNKNE